MSSPKFSDEFERNSSKLYQALKRDAQGQVEADLIVCVEHKKFIPCRECLYGVLAQTPYSDNAEDIKMVKDYQSGVLDE